VTDKAPKPSQQEVADAIAYFRATSNRRDLTDILTAALGGEPEPATTDPEHTHTEKHTLGQKLGMKK
jgi:hypothetical protein